MGTPLTASVLQGRPTLLTMTPLGFQVLEHAPGWTPEEMQIFTAARCSVADTLCAFRFRA